MVNNETLKPGISFFWVIQFALTKQNPSRYVRIPQKALLNQMARYQSKTPEYRRINQNSLRVLKKKLSAALLYLNPSQAHSLFKSHRPKKSKNKYEWMTRARPQKVSLRTIYQKASLSVVKLALFCMPARARQLHTESSKFVSIPVLRFRIARRSSFNRYGRWSCGRKE